MEPKSGAKKYVVGIIIIGLVIAGVSLAGRNKTAPSDGGEYANQNKTTDTDDTDTGETVTAKTGLTEITYTDANGFTPDNLSVHVGDTVKFINKSSGKMWVASDEHPIHKEYDGTSLQEHCAGGATPSFDQCSAGSEYSFTFDKAGSWNYHNHARSRIGGTITVK